ncbi:hypothetical protein ACFQX4_10100 [Roseomonas sp. GCM10028921]
MSGDLVTGGRVLVEPEYSQDDEDTLASLNQRAVRAKPEPLPIPGLDTWTKAHLPIVVLLLIGLGVVDKAAVARVEGWKWVATAPLDQVIMGAALAVLVVSV